jgi:hypothetical protein
MGKAKVDKGITETNKETIHYHRQTYVVKNVLPLTSHFTVGHNVTSKVRADCEVGDVMTVGTAHM